jgi:RNA polymerase sigma factor (sigma-70 family)
MAKASEKVKAWMREHARWKRFENKPLLSRWEERKYKNVIELLMATVVNVNNDNWTNNTFIHDDVKKILEKLTLRQRQVIRLRYGFEGGQEITFDEVGKILCISRQRAKQLEAMAINRMLRIKDIDILRDYIS